MTTVTWRQQAEAAFLSARNGLRRVAQVTPNPILVRPAPALEALHAALDVAEEAIRAGEQGRWRTALRDHFFRGGDYEPEPERYRPACRCKADLPWCDSLAAGQQAWIDHVVGRVAA